MSVVTMHEGTGRNSGVPDSPPEDLEGGRPTGSSKKPMPMTQMKRAIQQENPYTLTGTIMSEFLACLTIGLVIQFARGFYPGDPVAGAIGIGAGYTGATFFFSTLETSVHLYPLHTILHMICKTEGVLSGFLRLLVQFLAAFAVAGISLPILDSNYINTAIHPGSGISVGEALFVESFGEIFFALAAVQLVNYGERGVSVPLSALIMGITTIGMQTVAYPITSASFNTFRWLATNIVGSDVSLYFTDKWWIYLVSPLITFVVVLIINYFFGWLKESARDWKPKYSPVGGVHQE